MVLPETWTAAFILLISAALCFAIWPNLFKLASPQWRFELFSIDFALGSLLIALAAAYTLGSRGSELDFGDSMLVAGRRAELMAVGSGMVFAFGNMLYLATIALIGLSNATLLTFSVFGCAVAMLQAAHSRSIPLLAAVFVLAGAGAFAYWAAQSARPAAPKPNPGVRPIQATAKAMTSPAKGGITGMLAGLAFAGIWPMLSLAQTEEMGIGAYGGTLMAVIGILVATLFLNFFFMNISLEGGQIGYSSYLAGSFVKHATGWFCGAIWTAGALALYTAKTGAALVSGFEAWSAPFAGAVLAVLTGILFWQKMKLSAKAKRNKFLAVALFVGGIAVLLDGLRS